MKNRVERSRDDLTNRKKSFYATTRTTYSPHDCIFIQKNIFRCFPSPLRRFLFHAHNSDGVRLCHKKKLELFNLYRQRLTLENFFRSGQKITYVLTIPKKTFLTMHESKCEIKQKKSVHAA